ncbi:unnamed protein product [Phytophthora fragariaefolia]|uniref:Unnamed protein product n=1 Tax=Phytophthora fragariaefolia TaxID=1490495 RepID=A0A9W6Y6D4_9STRA|nr:unnamed protein product [Phytophthora fragariaefolia]
MEWQNLAFQATVDGDPIASGVVETSPVSAVERPQYLMPRAILRRRSMAPMVQQPTEPPGSGQNHDTRSMDTSSPEAEEARSQKNEVRDYEERHAIYRANAPADPIEAEVPWPGNVQYLEECEVLDRIEFVDIGDGHSCKCVGDCFMDTCCNAALAIFCTPECCALNASCSSAPRARKTLKLYDTGRVGLGVFTTTFLEVGDVVGEYTRCLCAYSALVVGQPAQAMKQNSGYTTLLNERAVNGKFVYIEALNCGSITRFMSHACDPNGAFVEMQNRTTLKVMAVIIKSVKAGAQLTVNYDNQIWFQCSCDDCWLGRSGGS